MEEITPQERFIGLLVRNEQQLGQLYRIYGEKLPSMKGFWFKIAGEEDEHAAMAERLFLHSKVDSGLQINEERFTSEAVESFIKFVGEIIEKVKDAQITESDTLYQALDIEKALLEKKVFEVFQSDEPRFMKTLIYLEVSTEWHISAIEREIEANKLRDSA